jgi:hypothetical protein
MSTVVPLSAPLPRHGLLDNEAALRLDGPASIAIANLDQNWDRLESQGLSYTRLGTMLMSRTPSEPGPTDDVPGFVEP